MTDSSMGSGPLYPGYELATLPQHDGAALARIPTDAVPLLDDHPFSSGKGVHNTRPLIVPDSKTRRRFSGWRVGALSGAAVAAATLIVNVVALVWLERHPSENTSLVELYRGDCGKVEQMQLWMHFAINALGTLLLSSSNYCMQVLCAPTRREVDRAHKRGKYLDIGVQSIRNLAKISPWRTVLWLLLGFSSVPLHLMYNSAFYSSIATYSYRYSFMATSPELSTADSNEEWQQLILEDSTTGGPLERLDPKACLDAYADVFTTERSNLVIVASNRTVDDSYWEYDFDESVALGGVDRYNPFAWICYSSARQYAYFGDKGDPHLPCDSWVSDIKDDIEHWTPYDYVVNFCLSERLDERCSFNGNIQVLIVVVCCNAVKIVCMLIVAFYPGKTPLITVGDAIASFLQEADSVTKGYCLLRRADVVKGSAAKDPRGVPYGYPHFVPPRVDAFGEHIRTEPRDFANGYPDEGRPAERRTETWSKVASRTRWIVTLGCIILAVLTVGALFGIGFSVITRFSTSISALGFGKIHPASLISGWDINYLDDPQLKVNYAILVANTPQTILSFLYLNLNSLVTCMWLASEWDGFAVERKHLRVSEPRGEQRSSYFLQLPYRVGVPLMVISGLLHWLVSQSIFLAVVSSYDWEGQLVEALSIATCGFSLIPMILVMVAGVGICVGTIWLGRRRRKAGASFMPLAGSCSLAIAAACHRPEWDEGAEFKAVQWGAVVGEHWRDVYGAGHCSFTSGQVGELQEGRLYR